MAMAFSNPCRRRTRSISSMYSLRRSLTSRTHWGKSNVSSVYDDEKSGTAASSLALTNFMIRLTKLPVLLRRIELLAATKAAHSNWNPKSAYARLGRLAAITSYLSVTCLGPRRQEIVPPYGGGDECLLGLVAKYAHRSRLGELSTLVVEILGGRDGVHHSPSVSGAQLASGKDDSMERCVVLRTLLSAEYAVVKVARSYLAHKLAVVMLARGSVGYIAERTY